ncbi:MAG: asparagine synthase (glutamine-hydrolyzing), partial [Alphaproteobacteria bacterium]
MCGIAGLMVSEGQIPDGNLLDRLAAALSHRGPDGHGRHVSGNLGMIQTRLAIIDLRTGDQPLYWRDGTALVANAEIYNYVELRAADPDVNYQTGSDCESPLHLYERHGLDFAQHLRGMYAIALHDPHRRRLALVRDPFGIKPLYYAETARGFVFASEPHAILAAGLAAPRVQAARRTELLQLQFTTGRATVFEGIERLLPGEMVVVSDGRIVERRRVSALPSGGPLSMSDDDALAQLDRILEDSVRIHQRSDVPYGMFLSGGIDSSVVLAMMARLNERPVVAFTAGFPDASVHDERSHARALARSFGAEHVEIPFTAQDFWSLLPEVAASLDDPVADYAVLPTYKLGAAAAGQVKVILSGEGGDEIFAGYGRYRSVMRPWWRGGRTLRARGVLDGLGVLRQENASWRDGIAGAEITATMAGRTPLQVAQATDCADWLPNDLLN